MSIVIVVGIALAALILVALFTNIGGDYTKKTDQQLLDLWPLHENNVRAAKLVGSEAHKKALEKMSTLTSEMKRRGILKTDFTTEDDTLDSVSKEMFHRSLGKIKKLAKENDAIALYQLGMIFHSVKEVNTSLQYMSKSANLGYGDAQYALGWAFMSEGKGVTRDARKAMTWFKIAATQGHIEAQKALEIAMSSFSKSDADFAFIEAEKWLAGKESAQNMTLEQ